MSYSCFNLSPIYKVILKILYNRLVLAMVLHYSFWENWPSNSSLWCTNIDEGKEQACHRYLLYICQVQNQYLPRFIASNQIKTITLHTEGVCKSSRKLENNLSSSNILDHGLLNGTEPAGPRGHMLIRQFCGSWVSARNFYGFKFRLLTRRDSHAHSFSHRNRPTFVITCTFKPHFMTFAPRRTQTRRQEPIKDIPELSTGDNNKLVLQYDARNI